LAGERLAPDCALRHAVSTAEKFRSLYAEIREKCPYFAVIPKQTGLERKDSYSARGAQPWLFSGRQMRSPVSTRA
jgi:hypothetical protein